MKRRSETSMFLPLSAIALSMCVESAEGNPTQAIEPNVPTRILGISVDPGSNQVTLRWSSNIGSKYTIEESTDLQKGWIRNLSGVPGRTDETILTISPVQDQGGSRTMFFRVLEIPRELIENTDTEITTEKAVQPETSSLDPQRLPSEQPEQEQALKLHGLSTEEPEDQGFQPTIHSPPTFAVG